jgi:hypothetical protein
MATSSEKIDSGIEVFEQDTSLQRSYGKEHGNTGADLVAGIRRTSLSSRLFWVNYFSIKYFLYMAETSV